jgi:hypothetical protein
MLVVMRLLFGPELITFEPWNKASQPCPTLTRGAIYTSLFLPAGPDASENLPGSLNSRAVQSRAVLARDTQARLRATMTF